jgi:transposase
LGSEIQWDGHKVKLIAPEYVKPFVKTNKSDANDAEAIAEAAVRPSMNFVSGKSVEQQDIQSIHRIRERLIT